MIRENATISRVFREYLNTCDEYYGHKCAKRCSTEGIFHYECCLRKFLGKNILSWFKDQYIEQGIEFFYILHYCLVEAKQYEEYIMKKPEGEARQRCEAAIIFSIIRGYNDNFQIRNIWKKYKECKKKQEYYKNQEALNNYSLYSLYVPNVLIELIIEFTV